MDALILLHGGHWLPSVLATVVPLLVVTALLVLLSRGSRRRG
jgi:lipopolysaccharide export LptBFGC system permease protein LptF